MVLRGTRNTFVTQTIMGPRAPLVVVLLRGGHRHRGLRRARPATKRRRIVVVGGRAVSRERPRRSGPPGAAPPEGPSCPVPRSGGRGGSRADALAGDAQISSRRERDANGAWSTEYELRLSSGLGIGADLDAEGAAIIAAFESPSTATDARETAARQLGRSDASFAPEADNVIERALSAGVSRARRLSRLHRRADRVNADNGRDHSGGGHERNRVCRHWRGGRSEI